jgi:hypothetical protein
MKSPRTPELVAHPRVVPWYLGHDVPRKEARTILGAFTAVLSAFCQDREDRGLSLPDEGIEGLMETAVAAWTVDAPERDRIDAAYTWTRDALE